MKVFSRPHYPVPKKWFKFSKLKRIFLSFSKAIFLIVGFSGFVHLIKMHENAENCGVLVVQL